MLKVVFYQSTRDLVEVEFLNLATSNPLVICPSPVIADGLRRLMPDALEIVTISKWVSDYLKLQNSKKINKADLLLRLSSVWRHYFPDAPTHTFLKSFEMFTELRSFSLNIELFTEFLKELDEVTTKSILLFWVFVQNEKIIDEHLSYQILSQIEVKRALHFVGFKHLSGIQIDMLKSIGEIAEVSVYCPKDILPESLSSDWIQWLSTETSDVQKILPKKIKSINFPKNKLNIFIKKLNEELSHFDIVLASSNQTLNLKQEVASKDLFFKSPEDLFKVKREQTFDSFLQNIDIEKIISVDNFKINIEERKTKALKKEDFVEYKILSLVLDALEYYGEFQTEVDKFALEILKVVVELNSPRVSLASIVNEPKSRLLELNEMLFHDSQDPLVVVASSSYGPLKTQDSKYSEKMRELLSAIGPLKRSGLDFAFLKSELNYVLSQEKNYLVMEDGLEVTDLGWREVLNDFTLEKVDIGVQYLLKKRKDYLQKNIKKGPHVPSTLSASRLQTFIDCPRKYYFSYIEKIDHRPDERLNIAADEMGIIEHAVIAKYFNESAETAPILFDNKKHYQYCKETLDHFLATKNIVLSEKDKTVKFFELLHYTQNGIEFLISFAKNSDVKKIEFEYQLGENPWKLVGAIDCVVTLKNDELALFDFKRSSAAIGSKNETLNFDKIQIWTYLLAMKEHGSKKIHTWGYINLSEIDSSQLYYEHEKEILNDDKMNEFKNVLERSIENICAEVDFLPAPRAEKNCDFCEISLFCIKKESV